MPSSSISDVKDWIMRKFATLVCLSLFPLFIACGDSGGAEEKQLAIPTPDAKDTVVPEDVVEDTAVSYEDDCGDGLICILGECLDRSESTSCIAFGQCCEEGEEDCAFGADGCFCDAYCVEAGDCCPDACAACGFCIEGEDDKSVAPSCDDCVALDCGDCKGCQPQITECDKEGEDCADEGAVRCGEDDSGHFIEVCTQLDSCRRWLKDTICESLNFCTNVPDVCVDGACVPDGDPNETCVQPDDPCIHAVCEPGTGACSEEPAAEFAPCDDGSLCTVNEQCFNGECVGNNLGDVEGEKSTDYFVDSEVYYIDLGSAGTTDVIDGFACEGQEAGYDGNEFSIEVSHTYDFTDVSILITLELEDASMAGTSYADVAVLSKVPGTCWPDACLFGAMMDDNGRLELTLPVEEAKQTWTLVVDGRDGFEGNLRMTASYWDGAMVETFCGDGEDNDGDGNTDCEDIDCFDSNACSTETTCDDGADNDQDGFEDCLDPDCAEDAFCLPEQDCEGEADTDGDGLTGCDDPDCNGVGSCGEVIACEEAIPLSCFETLTEQVLTDGSDNFTGVEIPACGVVPKETYSVHKQLVYHVQLPDNCTSFSPHVSPGNYQSVYAFGPDCTENACSDGGFAGAGTGTDGAVFDAYLTEGWIVVTTIDGDPPAIANMPFEIQLDCACQ